MGDDIRGWPLTPVLPLCQGGGGGGVVGAPGAVRAARTARRMSLSWTLSTPTPVPSLAAWLRQGLASLNLGSACQVGTVGAPTSLCCQDNGASAAYKVPSAVCGIQGLAT